MGHQLKKNILISIAFAFIISIALAFYSDFNSIISSLQNFPPLIIPLLLLIMLCNFLLRFLKWHFYIKILNIKISIKDSLFIFFSGLSMGVTPGKWGELIKSYLLKEISGVSISKTAPIIFAERITDIISLIILALFGALIYQYNSIGLIVLIISFAFLLYLIGNHSFGNAIIKYLTSFKLISKYVVTFQNLYDGSKELLKIVPLIKMLLISFVMWIIEFFGFYIILSNFIDSISFLWASFAYAFAIIVGSFSMFPGGLGFTEGTLTFFLVNKGLTKADAVAITVLIRLVTLWFSVIIGIITLIFYQRMKHKDFSNIEIMK